MKILLFLIVLNSYANCFGIFGKRRFPKNIGVDGVGKSHIQYGFESEFTMKEANKLLDNYMPDSNKVNISKSEWLEMGHEDRVRFIDSNKDQLFPDYRNEGNFIKIADDPYGLLPDSFLLDSNNFEIRVGPFDSYEEWKQVVDSIGDKIGVGSMQASMSVPQKSFFAGESAVSDNMGYFRSINELDTLEKLDNGFQKLKSNPNILAAKSFNHPWLGPSNSKKDDILKSLLERNKNGDYQGMDAISANITSHKFISGTVYRPDVATNYKRILNEVRDCHKDIKCLEKRVKRFESIHLKNKDVFEPGNQFVSFNREESFAKLKQKLEKPSSLLGSVTEGGPKVEFLKDLFPNYWNSANQSHTVLDNFLNFSYPMRDWSGHILALKKSSDKLSIKLAKTIQKAQTNYVNELTEIAKGYKLGTLTKEQAQIKVQGSLVKFSNDSKIYEVMKDWFQTKVTFRYVGSISKLVA